MEKANKISKSPAKVLAKKLYQYRPIDSKHYTGVLVIIHITPSQSSWPWPTPMRIMCKWNQV